MDLKNKKILVTGGAVRLGAGISLYLARAGAEVIIHYFHSSREAEQLQRKITGQGLKCDLVLSDLSDLKNLRDQIKTTIKKHGSIDGLVCNASIFPHTPFFSVTEKDWDRTLSINLKGHFFLCQLIGQKMMAQKTGQIVFITDVSANNPWPGYLPYTISKAGLEHMVKGLAKVLAPYVRVNGVAPGTVLPPENVSAQELELYKNRTLLKKIGTPDSVAKTVAFLFNNSDFITGAIIPVDGGYSIKD